MTASIIKACKFVGRPDLNDALFYLDLLTEDDLKTLRDDDEHEGAGHVAMVSTESAYFLTDILSTAMSEFTCCHGYRVVPRLSFPVGI